MLGAAGSVGALATGFSSGTSYSAEYKGTEDPFEGAQISGRIKYNGPPIEFDQLRVTKDQSFCGPALRTRELMRVGEDGVLADAVVHVKGMTSGRAWSPLFDEAKVFQKDCRFQPYVQVSKRDALLHVINLDPLLHNVHAYEILSLIHI